MKRILSFTILFLFIFIACAPTTVPVSTPTPVGFIAPSVEVVEKFYKTVNEAETEEDLLAAYGLLTTYAMCLPKIAPNCDTSIFQAKWWQSKVGYKLYDCGDNVAIAEETRHPRDDSLPSTSDAPRYSRFKLKQTEDGLLIDDISLSQTPVDDCVLVFES